MYKLICLDLDGTLINSNGEIDLETNLALKKAHEQGAKIVIATGRPFLGALRVFNQFLFKEKNAYMICFNGGIIYSLENKKIIYQKTIPCSLCKELYLDAIKNHIFFQAYDLNQELLVPTFNPYTKLEMDINQISYKPFDILSLKDDTNLIKCMLVEDENILNKKQDYFINKYSSSLAVVRSHANFLEFLDKTSTKGDALNYLRELLKIKKEDIISFGDSENDISLLENSGFAVAMGNANEKVKKIANYTTLSNNENGIGYFLKKFVL